MNYSAIRKSDSESEGAAEFAVRIVAKQNPRVLFHDLQTDPVEILQIDYMNLSHSKRNFNNKWFFGSSD